MLFGPSITAFDADVNAIPKILFGSTLFLETMKIVMLAVVCPGANVTVPEAGLKSFGEVALTPTVFQATETVFAGSGRVSVTGTFKATWPPVALPSTDDAAAGTEAR